MKGRVAAAEQRHNEAMMLAWHVVALPMLKPFPKTPDALMIRDRPPAPPQTKADMLLAMRAWTAATRH
jgi:hypothetical protein